MTAETRKNVAGMFLLPVGVTNNAAKDAEWRAQAGWGYGAIAAASPSGEATVPWLIYTRRAR